jgi:hypothetical protein
MRDIVSKLRAAPDCASLHPGYDVRARRTSRMVR